MSDDRADRAGDDRPDGGSGGILRSSSVGLARTPRGRRVEASAVIDAPPRAAWDLLVETERWPEWGPSVRAVDCPPGECPGGRIGENSRGRVQVRAPGGPWVPFRVRRFDADGPVRYWDWRVARVPATGHRVEPVGGDRASAGTGGDRPADADADRPGGGDGDRTGDGHGDRVGADRPDDEPEPGRCRVAFELSPAAAGYAVVCRRALGRIAAVLAREGG